MGGCYTGVDVKGTLTARRRSFDRVREPPYQVSQVAKCSRDLKDSVIVAPPTRECWFQCITEMLLLCNEAAGRFAKAKAVKRKEEADGIQSKPLGLEYMADRLDTDDPIFGYMVRTKREGWLQGFITLTTFTTWHKDFEWNSLVKEAGISDDEKRMYRWDYNNKLALALQAQHRDGDPNEEGIVWHRVAEVSLLGALGCGAQLLQLLIDELETGDKYDFLVLQATDNAVGFYEKMGFTRVGAIARPDQEAVAAQHAQAQAQREAKALERERQRLIKLEKEKDKDLVKNQLARPGCQAGSREVEVIWRVACREVLSDLMQSEHAKKLEWPRTIPGQQVAKSFAQARTALEANKYKDTVHFVCDVIRLLRHIIAANPSSTNVKEACESLLEAFKSAWQGLGEEKDTDAATSTRFFLYVDDMWEERQGYRLFQLYGDVEDKAPNKAYVQAREWRQAKESEYSCEPEARQQQQQQQTFVPKNPKPQKLCWTPRRDLDGMLHTETMCVKVLSAPDGSAFSDACEMLVVKNQAKAVALAYARLHAMRALQQFWSEAAVGKQQQQDLHLKGNDSPACAQEEAMSEYEVARRKRMEENARLMQATGILTLAKEVEDAVNMDADDPHHHHHNQQERDSPTKRKRSHAAVTGEVAGEEDSEEQRRTLRSKMKTQGGLVQECCKGDGELDKCSLSDVDTPLKAETTVVPVAAAAAAVGSAAVQQQEQEEDEEEKAPTEHHHETESAGDGDAEGERQRGGGGDGAEGEEGAVVAGGGVGMPAKTPLVSPLPAEWEFPEDARHVAKEDETPRFIAKMFGLDLQSLVKINKAQYPTLTYNSRLRKGTLLQLPRPGEVDVFIPAKKLDEKGEGWFAYCHWTYPDQQVEEIHPSYMMVRVLQRRKVEDLSEESMLKKLGPLKAKLPPKIKSAQQVLEDEKREKHQALAAPDEFYECAEDDRIVGIAKKLHVDADRLVLCNRPTYPTLNKTVALRAGTRLRLPPRCEGSGGDGEGAKRCDWWKTCHDIVTKLKNSRLANPFETAVDWEELGLVDYPFIINEPMDLGTVESKLLCDQYHSPEQVERDVRLVFENAMQFNAPDDQVHVMAEKMLKMFKSLWSNTNLVSAAASSSSSFGKPAAATKTKKPKNMFNKVVAIEGGPKGYFFVLHYIPDMQWCHLAEMGQYGTFPKTYKNGKPHAFAGRTQWKLVPEGEGSELDVSADRCRVVNVVVNRVTDADKEAWDILDDNASAVPQMAPDTEAGVDLVVGTKGGKEPDEGASGSKREHKDSSSVSKGDYSGSPSKRARVDVPAAAGDSADDRGDENTRPEDTTFSWHKDARNILSKIRSNKKAWPFLQPVDPVQDECLDYLRIIKEPMDLGTVETKLTHDMSIETKHVANDIVSCPNVVGRYYQTAHAFVVDILLTFENALIYNPVESQVHKMAQEMTTIACKHVLASRCLAACLPSAQKQLQDKREMSTEGSEATAGAGQSEVDTEEMKQLQAALALKVQAPGRTSLSKVSSAALRKIAQHLSGSCLKIDCSLSQTDLSALVHTLKANCSTTRLDIDGCGIGDSGCELLSELIVANKRLAVLDLQLNQLTDSGVKVLAEAVPKSGLVEVHLGNNSVTAAGAEALMEAAKMQQKLTGSTLTICGLSDTIMLEASQKANGLVH